MKYYMRLQYLYKLYAKILLFKCISNYGIFLISYYNMYIAHLSELDYIEYRHNKNVKAALRIKIRN